MRDLPSDILSHRARAPRHTGITDDSGRYELTLQTNVPNCDPIVAPETCVNQLIRCAAGGVESRSSGWSGLPVVLPMGYQNQTGITAKYVYTVS